MIGYGAFRRGLDVVVSAVGIVVLSPLLAGVAAWSLTTEGRPVLFRQRRVGLGGREFVIYKFRTMRVETRDLRVQTHDRSEGVTRIGSVLRRFKIDELPQLFNVLKGDMSLIGPRPCLPHTVDDFDAELMRIRHRVRPGLAGLAQVHGNAGLSWSRKLEYDVQYVQNRNPMLDLRILVRTVMVVLFGDRWGDR